MHDVLNNFTQNQVWTLEERPKGARVIGTNWVLLTIGAGEGLYLCLLNFFKIFSMYAFCDNPNTPLPLSRSLEQTKLHQDLSYQILRTKTSLSPVVD